MAGVAGRRRIPEPRKLSKAFSSWMSSTVGGQTWKTQPSPIKGWLTSVAFDKANRGWITHDDGFLVSEDGGETWKVVKSSGRFFLSKLARVNDTMWALGQSNLLRQTGSGLEWKRIESLALDKTAIMAAPAPGPAQPTPEPR